MMVLPVLPLEIINMILSYRPVHPVARLIKVKLEEYFEEEEDYLYGQYRYPLYKHTRLSFIKWAFLCINRR